jgi:hypothetical protein
MTVRRSGSPPQQVCGSGRTPHFANLTALLALFVALGGSSYAALVLPKASLGAKPAKG